MLYLGCSQWSYSWLEDFNTKKIKEKDQLYYYSQEFNCAELNSTYYEIIDNDVISDWHSRVNSSFKFCPKFPKEISHDRKLYYVEKLTDEFINSVKGFEEKLGVCFLQLPLSMLPENIYLIDELLAYINNRIKISIEIRPHWLGRVDILSECFKVLRKHDAGIVMVDSVKTIKYLNNLKLTNSSAFIRFLSYDHPTDFDRINDWVKLIKYWQSKSIKEIYFILHLPESIKVPKIVNYAIEQFNEHLGLQIEQIKQTSLFL